MTIFVDASALVAMMTNEPEDGQLVDTLTAHRERFYSAIAHWEAAAAVARKRKTGAIMAEVDVADFAKTFAIRLLPLRLEEMRGALEAYDRYGRRSNHPAQLNMGDCFAYAFAKLQSASLLYKGDDFSKTDLA